MEWYSQELVSYPETRFPAVILRSKATKNLLAQGGFREILRSAQNDNVEFPDGYKHKEGDTSNPSGQGKDSYTSRENLENYRSF